MSPWIAAPLTWKDKIVMFIYCFKLCKCLTREIVCVKWQKQEAISVTWVKKLIEFKTKYGKITNIGINNDQDI